MLERQVDSAPDIDLKKKDLQRGRRSRTSSAGKEPLESPAAFIGVSSWGFTGFEACRCVDSSRTLEV